MYWPWISDYLKYLSNILTGALYSNGHFHSNQLRTNLSCTNDLTLNRLNAFVQAPERLEEYFFGRTKKHSFVSVRHHFLYSNQLLARSSLTAAANLRQRKISLRTKGRVVHTVIRPILFYCCKTWVVLGSRRKDAGGLCKVNHPPYSSREVSRLCATCGPAAPRSSYLYASTACPKKAPL